jgi:hypothetical protein
LNKGLAEKMLLLDGISGFHHHDLSEVDSAQFKKLCHSWANMNHGKFVSFEKPNESQNFYKAELNWTGDRIFLLLNSSYPIVAFASSVEYFNIKFSEHPHTNLIEVFKNDFTIATVDELVAPLIFVERSQTVLNNNNLNKSELSQVFYWKPNTVGEVVYNYWG